MVGKDRQIYTAGQEMYPIMEIIHEPWTGNNVEAVAANLRS
jgi:hypothetical protein